MSGAMAQRKRRTGKETDAADDSASTKTNDGLLRFEEEGDELLPGIPNEITDGLITSKLDWKTFRILSGMSRAWNQVFQSCLEARVRLMATEKQVEFECCMGRPFFPAAGFVVPRFCMQAISEEDDKFAYELPPIPTVGEGYPGDDGFPIGCEFAFLDGKIYAVGGDQYEGNVAVPSDRVYVFDLAGQRHWRQCKNMQYARTRREFGRGVRALRGKICVFLGTGRYNRCTGVAQVYDPKSDTWDLIDECCVRRCPCRYSEQLRLQHLLKSAWRILL